MHYVWTHNAKIYQELWMTKIALKRRFIVFVLGHENERWIGENDKCGGPRICLRTIEIKRLVRQNDTYGNYRARFSCIL
jgi:hypothetical protein